jgi:hypothetical protein
MLVDDCDKQLEKANQSIFAEPHVTGVTCVTLEEEEDLRGDGPLHSKATQQSKGLSATHN